MESRRLSKRNFIQAAAMAALVGINLSGCDSGPSKYERESLDDLKVLKSLCDKENAGDRICKTIGDVQSFSQLTLPEQYPNWESQYGMKSPWTKSYLMWTPTHPMLCSPEGGMYWSIELPEISRHGVIEKYKKIMLVKSAQKPTPSAILESPLTLSRDGYYYGSAEVIVDSPKSIYAWSVEELTTKEMRDHWIGGGRAKIFNRLTGELLAERVDFYRATGPSVKMAWAPGVNCANPSSGYRTNAFVHPSITMFVKHVLRLPSAGPNDLELQRL